MAWPGDALRDALDRYLIPLGQQDEPPLGAGPPSGRKAAAEDSRRLQQNLSTVRRLCSIFLTVITSTLIGALALLLWTTVRQFVHPLVTGGTVIASVAAIGILRALWRDAVITMIALAVIRDLPPAEAVKVIRVVRGERFGR